MVRYLTIISMLVGSTIITFDKEYPKPEKFVVLLIYIINLVV